MQIHAEIFKISVAGILVKIVNFMMILKVRTTFQNPRT